MKSLSPAFQAHLDEGTTSLAWCWRIARADGVSFGFTGHDRTLSFDGTDFGPESRLTASEMRSGSDLSVDAQEAEGVLTSDRITETDIRDGRWDNAEVEVWRVNWSDPTQRADASRGDRPDPAGRLAFVAEVRSLTHILGQTLGRTFQATCDAVLGDGRCSVDLDGLHAGEIVAAEQGAAVVPLAASIGWVEVERRSLAVVVPEERRPVQALDHHAGQANAGPGLLAGPPARDPCRGRGGLLRRAGRRPR